MTDPDPDLYQAKPPSYFATPRREMLDFLAPGRTSVLEIGCGDGRFGALVKQRDGCRYTGVELMPEAAARAAQLLDRVLVAHIEHDPLPLEPASFDALICNDVLEHLVDPWKALRELTRFLRPGAAVVISVPNVRHSEVVKDLVIRNRWDYQDEGVMDRTHLRFFTRRSVASLMEQAGIEVQRLEGINATRHSWRLHLINIAFLGSLSSMRFLQIGASGRLRSN